MTMLIVLLALYAAAALAYWLWQAYAFRQTRRDVPRLERVAPPEPAEWPRLSVIVPADNQFRGGVAFEVGKQRHPKRVHSFGVHSRVLS